MKKQFAHLPKLVYIKSSRQRQWINLISADIETSGVSTKRKQRGTIVRMSTCLALSSTQNRY